MPALTAAQLERLRRTRQHTRLFINFLRPYSLWSAEVNDPGIAVGERDIIFNSGAGPGFIWDWVQPYQTLYVGTTPGGRDLGTARIRSITSPDSGITGTITVAANSVYWQDGAFLTIVQDYKLWSVFPRIDSNEVFYKDFDIAYTDQNEQLKPIPIMGAHQARFSVPGVGYTYNFPVHQSYTIDPTATITNHAVSIAPLVAGMTIGIYSPVTGVDITIPDGSAYYGHYWVKLEVTDSNGKMQVSYRAIFHNDPVPGNANYPHTDFSSVVISGDWDEGGWAAEVTVEDRASLADIPDGTLAVVWAEQTFNDGLFDMCLFDNSTNVYLAGYVMKDQFTSGRESSAGFTVATVDTILKNRSLFSVSLESRDDPETWWQYLNGYLTAGRITHHFYSEHSSLFQITDVLGLDDDGNIQRKAVDIERGTLYTMVDDLVRNRGIFAHICCDKQGRIYMTRDLAYRDLTARNAALVVAEAEKPFIIPPITFVRAPEPETAFVFLSGVSYDGTNAVPIGSTAPYAWPSPFGGDIEDIERRMLLDQADTNRLVGQIFAVKNNIFPEIRVNFSGNFLGVLETALPEWWTLVVAQDDTIREIALSEQRMICRNVNAVFDLAAGTQDVTAVFEPEVQGVDGIVYNWPPESPDPGGEPTPIPVIDTPGDGFGTCYVLVAGTLGRTRDLSAGSPAWTDISPIDGNTFNDFVLDPWDPYSNGYVATESGVWKSTELLLPSPSWNLVLSVADVLSDLGASAARKFYHALASINAEDYVAVFFAATVGGTERLYCARSFDAGATWAYGTVFTPTGGFSLAWEGAADYVPHQVGGAVRLYAACGDAGASNLFPKVRRSDDNGATWIGLTDFWSPLSGQFPSPRSIHVPFTNNPNGDTVYVSAEESTGAGSGLWKSVNAGASWANMLSNRTTVHRFAAETYTPNDQRGFYWNQPPSGDGTLFVTDDAFATTATPASAGIVGQTGASGGFPYVDNQFYALTSSGIFVTVDRGENWLTKTGDWAFGFAGAKVIVPLWLAE